MVHTPRTEVLRSALHMAMHAAMSEMQDGLQKKRTSASNSSTTRRSPLSPSKGSINPNRYHCISQLNSSASYIHLLQVSTCPAVLNEHLSHALHYYITTYYAVYTQACNSICLVYIMNSWCNYYQTTVVSRAVVEYTHLQTVLDNM